MAGKKTIFVVSGYHDIITDVFDTCEDAAKRILDGEVVSGLNADGKEG